MKAACSGPVGKGITIVIEVKGKFNTALCYTPALDGKAEEQIRLVCDEEAFRDSKIRIMPDVHAGKGCTIGTTMTITDKVVPGMVGVDIGCGMETVRIAQREIDSEKLDALIRSAIPCGREVRRASHEYCSSIDLSALRCAPYVNLERAKKSIGTLGGGNHFIEADRSDTGDIYIVVHSGSRHLGVEVADYYQEQGRMALWGGARYQIGQLIETLKSKGRFQEIQPAVTALKKEHKISIPKDLAYVEGKLREYFETQAAREAVEEQAAPYLPDTGYVPTTVSEDIYKGIKFAQLERGMVVLHGDAGIGKTEGARKFLHDYPHSTVFITATPTTGSLGCIIKLLARALGVPDEERDAFLRQDAGWIVNAGGMFGEEGKGFERINIALPRPELQKALDRLSLAAQKVGF